MPPRPAPPPRYSTYPAPRYYTSYAPPPRVYVQRYSYAPPPPPVRVVTVEPEHRREVREAPKRPRGVDRADTLAVGFRMSSLLSGYRTGTSYGDFGLGADLRWRPLAPVAIELAATQHDQSWDADSERRQSVISASGMVFAFSKAKVQPYALAGVTYTGRDILDVIGDGDGGLLGIDTNRPMWGPHGGVGLELALGQRAALDLEARWIGYLNPSDTDPSLPGAVQTTGALQFYF
jgi:hypothetical protein